ncbi:sigma-70 family RNA polymerase sigma factor [Saccharopolyspora rhizosphaerae]|uniref:Sigma-70 family RNA polymerase sigma factor n=1 Tax=Saccharopolyspora rhizosphaerae TaxID=2492662 RepID=A0A426K1G3_9PSEU|nr:sigma-70 family RNA polymerase sigma factor [Saccharopolyspora rhizosphaerae]RRO19272.1 sigma-70 family RNA polymerase sigma factor [Saccharopolyspora rhizosphaerae]
MKPDTSTLAADFDRHRSRLIGLGYRLTGRLADAEDAVQDAWLRLTDADPAEIRDLGSWLTTVVSRLCLDKMRSAAVRRESYVGPWLPEPLVSSVDSDPGDIVAGQDDLRMAAMRVLHELPPDQRLALVLHDGFDVPFAEIAEVLGCSVPSARQHASRARKVMNEAAPPERAPLPEQQRALEDFLTAVAAKDLAALTRLLNPTAAVYGDSGGKARTARRPVVGAEKVARFAVGLIERYGTELVGSVRPVLVNGDLGLLFPGTPETAPRVFSLAVRDGRPAELFDIVNPDKLTHVEFKW